MILPAIAKAKDLPYSEREGWLSGIFEYINSQDNTPFQLGIAYPLPEGEAEKEVIDGVSCYAFSEDLSVPEAYDEGLEESFKRIVNDFRPDILHVFGTEFPHGLAAVKVFGNPDRTLLGIQGLCYKIASLYTKDIPENVVNRRTLRDILRKDSLIEQQNKFKVRGEREKEIIRLVNHITGRTEFDRENTLRIHPQAQYHLMNETMRSCFYEGRWQEESCRKHSIFLSQGDYPIKGLHYVLEVLPMLRKKYPDVHLYVAGIDITGRRNLKKKLKISSYGRYLVELIKKYKLKNNVTMLGVLNAQQMKEQYLKSHVFVCPSIVENSPNALSEAMLLGVPVVAAKTGGIPSMLDDGKEGVLYEAGNVGELMWAIIRAFEVGKVFSEQERRRALMVHDGENNYKTLLSIYHKIYES